MVCLEAAVLHRGSWMTAVILFGVACGGEFKEEGEPAGPDYSMLDMACPGTEGCASNQGALHAGAAVVDALVIAAAAAPGSLRGFLSTK